LDKDYTQRQFLPENILITDYFKSDTAANTGLFLKLLQITGYDNILGTYGTFTVFEPTNDAINQFVAENGKTSIEDFSPDYLVKLVKAHIVNTTFNSFQFKSGALDDSTLLGNYLVVSFAASGFSATYINKTAKVIRKDIVCSNGIVHKIDHILTPVIDNLYSYLQKHAEYSIITQAIAETGYDSLLVLGAYNDAYRHRVERSFTLFAEPDSVFHKAKINSYSDLKAKYSNTGNPKNRKDSLNLFVGYHILTGRIYSQNFTSKNYTTAGYDLLISVIAEDVVKMNPDSIGEETIKVWDQATLEYVDKQVAKYSYAYLIDNLTNTDVTNGLIHGIDKVMPPKKPVAQTYVLPLFDKWVKQYVDSVTRRLPTVTFQNFAGTAVKIFARDSVLSYFKGRMSWVINYLGPKAPQADPTLGIQSDDREICYNNQQKIANGGHFLGSIVSNPLGDANGNCFFVVNYNEYEVTYTTDYIVPGKYKVGLGYKNGNRYTIRVIVDDDPSLLDEKASYVDPSYGGSTGYLATTGQTYMKSLGAIRDAYAGSEWVECQMGSVIFLDKRKHRIKITNMTQYGAPGGNFGKNSLLDYIRLEAVK
jgi:uncharacterized surface protein with fasciclin (FAS1) repeats